MSDYLQPHGLQHARIPCPSPTPGAYSNSFPQSRWCHPNISSSVIPFSSCFQSFPASGAFQMSQFFASGGQSIGVSASASVLPMNIQDWFSLRWTGWISLQSNGLSRVFSNTTIQIIILLKKADHAEIKRHKRKHGIFRNWGDLAAAAVWLEHVRYRGWIAGSGPVGRKPGRRARGSLGGFSST